MRLDAVLDHVAIAVPDRDKAEARWRDQLGGGRLPGEDTGVFASRSLQYPDGARLEMIAPSPTAKEPTFITAFLERYGAQVHHVTLKVPDLRAAVDTLDAAGLEVVDVRLDDPVWSEAFLRPRQVGGFLVQVAHTPYSPEDFLRMSGQTAEPPRPDAARLLGPVLAHPDLARARDLWQVLGATVEEAGDELRCRWPDSPLVVALRPGGPGPLGLRMAGTEPLPRDDTLGPAVLPA